MKSQMSHTRHETAKEDKVPLNQKTAVSFGAMSQAIANNALSAMANLIYNIELGVSPALVGLAQMLPRFLDAMIDPIMGNFSDNTRSRYGRRKPYLFIGALFMGALFAAIWLMPRGWSQYAYFAYFLSVSILFWTATTVFIIPYNAFAMELTPDYHERSRVMILIQFFMNAGMAVVPWIYWLTQRDCFVDTIQGMRVVGTVTGLILAATGLVCAIICKEKKYEQVKTQESVDLFNGVKITCCNKTFLLLITIVIIAVFGYFVVTPIFQYLTIYLLFDGNTKDASFIIGMQGTVWILLVFAFSAPITMLATRIGKKNTFLFAMLLMIIGSLCKIPCYQPAYPWLSLVPYVFMSPAILMVFGMAFSMLADICDLDEIETNKRREGSYCAVYQWITKMGFSLAFMAGGLVLAASGFDEKLKAQTVSTINQLRFWEVVIPIVSALLASLLMTKYRLTEDRAYQIKAELQQRRVSDELN